LDNGLFENHIPEPIESLVEKALKIGATTFFAPDMLYDSKGTATCLKTAISITKGTGLKIAAVVQADNELDYMKQLLEFNKNPNVDLIGLSILSIPKSFGGSITESRIQLLKEMKRMADEESIVWKSCHLLGLGDGYADVLYASENCPFVVSNDTSSAFQTALFGRTYNGELEVIQGKVKEKVDFELKDVPESILQEAYYNITKIKKIIK